MNALRTVLAAALLACASGVVSAQPSLRELGRREQALNLEHDLMERMPVIAGEDEVDRRDRASAEAMRILRPQWDEEDRREAAGRGGAANAVPYQRRSREGTVRLDPQQQREAEQQRHAEREEAQIAANTAPGQDSFVSVYRSSWPSRTSWNDRQREIYRQHQLWCENNPDPCAREQRRIAAQEAAAAREQQRREQWQVMHIRQRTCQPLPEWIQGVNTPQEALAYIRARDPDADIDGRSDAQIVTILTSGEPVNLAHGYVACAAAFRMVGR